MAVTFDQMKKINILKVERDGFKILTDSLSLKSLNLERLVANGKLLVSNLEKSIVLKDSIICATEEKYNIEAEKNRILLKKQKNRKTWNTVLYTIGGTLIAGLTTTVIILAQ